MADSKDAAVIGEEASLSGKFKGQDLVVLGRLDGEIELKGRLRVGPKGSVRARVGAASIEVEGEMEGELRSDSLSLLPTARVRGTFVAKRLSVQEGALVEGSVNPSGGRGAEPPAPPAQAPAPAPPVVPAPGPAAATAPAPGPAPGQAQVPGAAPAPEAAPPSGPKPEGDAPK